MPQNFYITTPIYYPNGEPHLGHCYCTVVTDVMARYHRLAGHPTWFLTGTDEHGIKMVKTAAATNTTPQELADRNSAIFRDFWRELGISNDDYIRTSEPRHKAAVQEIIRRMLTCGDIYLGSYEGWYDEGQEEFVTETEAKAREYKSAVNGKPLVRYKEPSYFFRLSKYAPLVQQYIEANPNFIQPESRRNEVLSKLRQGVDDLSISRATLKWGIPLPHDPEHVVYVWIDALSNYITALGYTAPDESRFREFWPGVHIIGKEILWFHAVYWPAMLMSLGLPLPTAIFAHGWWTSNGMKMSKTLGNAIDLEKIRSVIATYSNDALRYYLVRAAGFGSDLDWTDGDFLKSFNELANVVGNCLNRTIKMIHKYRGGVVPSSEAPWEALDQALVDRAHRAPEEVRLAYAGFDLQQAALTPVELARQTNGYIDATEPFRLAKDPEKARRLDIVLGLSAQAIYRSLVLLLPILPEKAAAGLRQLNVDCSGKTLSELLATPPLAGHKLGEGQPLFPKVELAKGGA
jgi:methionyl-tRNA synthetase